MQKDSFTDEVREHLKFYVYRLIDPRNGETFYVGKGQRDRIFDHVKGALSATNDDDTVDLKFKRIRDIRAAGLEVGHVIHRHHIEQEDVALEIEAALMDAYPGLTNKVGGHGSGDYGCRHVRQIIAEYSTEPFVLAEPLILISIARSHDEQDKNTYESVRGVWKISKERAERYKLVLAHSQGIVRGAFRPEKWLPATKENFPLLLEEDIPGRIGFEGHEAEPKTRDLYVHKRVPDNLRRKGAANPVRFVDAEIQINA